MRELPGPPGAATVVLLHGWTATADLNWYPSFVALGQCFQVVAMDHRGHGQGIRSRRPFRLADCADDVAALLDAIGVEYATIVGYSMGGAVAQLVWRRHRPRVRSLVLAATSRNFASSREESISFMGLAGLAVVSRVVPDSIRQRIAEQYVDKRAGMGWETWALEQIRSHDWTAVLEAGRAIGSFSSIDWIGSVDVPTSVIVNSDDHVVPTHRQLALSESITHARVFHIEGDHDVCVVGADRFVPLLIEAIAVSLHDA